MTRQLPITFTIPKPAGIKAYSDYNRIPGFQHSLEATQCVISCYAMKVWNSPMNSRPWFVSTSPGTMKRLNTPSSIPRAEFLENSEGRGISSTHFVKCTMHTMTHEFLAEGITRGLVKITLHIDEAKSSMEKSLSKCNSREPERLLAGSSFLVSDLLSAVRWRRGVNRLDQAIVGRTICN